MNEAPAATGGKAPAATGASASTRAGGAGSQPVVELRDLTRRFGERPALEGVSVRLHESETLGVFGANGAGKTTLLRVLAGLLRPHGGVALVAGARLPDEAWRVRARIGYLGHDPLLYRELSPRENLRFHARLHAVDVARAELLLEGVGIGRRADDPVRELSRGMVQRVAAARALLHDPELLLLDEPRAGLDPAGAALLEPLIGRASGRTRVLVTHDVEGGLAECDTALGLRGGRQALCEPAGELSVAELRRVYA